MKNNFWILLLSFIVNLIAICTYINNGNANIIFVSSWLICGMIIFKARISFFSTVSFIICYIMIPVFFQTNFGYSYGMIELYYIPLYEKEIYFYILIGLDLMIVFLCFTRILEKEKNIYKFDYAISDSLFVISCVGTIILSFVAFPRLPFTDSSGKRFDMLLPGNAWNHLALVFLILATLRFKTSYLSKISVLFTVFWFLSHGERVDIMGYLLGAFVVYFNTHKVNLKNGIISVVSVVFVVMAFNLIGYIRSNQIASIPVLIYNLVVQKTAADLAYVFNSSIHFSKTSNLYNGLTYTSYFYNLIPFADLPYLTENILHAFYKTAGGEFIFCEPIINFGFFGFVVYEFIELALINLLLNKIKYKYVRYVFIFMIFTQFRILWYGRTYIMTSIFVFIPIVLIFEYCLDQGKYPIKIIDTTSQE